MKTMKIVFMGTPEFAVTILESLQADEQLTIVGVITAPDKPAGRGQKIHSSPVKDFAVEHSLHCLQPTNLKDPAFLAELASLQAELFVVVAFRMLPEVVWAMPPLGTINLHASLLPHYRGAAPINWAIINGETETGVTTFFIEREIDTGAVIEQRKISIGTNTSVGELYADLMTLGAETTLTTVHKILTGDVKGIEQDELSKNSELKAAPKIFKEDCEIDFTQNVQSVHNFCRGLDPYPGAWCTLQIRDKQEAKTFKFFSVERTELSISDSTHIKQHEDGILIPCSDFYLLAKEVQMEGKRKMTYKEFLAGHEISGFHL
jgi:methionyl-tRNA formyltransferase